jgi:hypothetical protein
MLGKLARLRRREESVDIWDASQPIWRAIRDLLDRHARGGDSESDILYNSSGKATLGGISYTAEWTVAPERSRKSVEIGRQALRELLDQAESEGGQVDEAIRLILELAPRGDRGNIEVDRQVDSWKFAVLPSLTQRCPNGDEGEWLEDDILAEFDSTEYPRQREYLEQLGGIGGLRVAEQLSERIAPTPRPMQCQILKVLNALASQPYESPDDEASREGHAEGIASVLGKLTSLSQSEELCGLLDSVIDEIRNHGAEFFKH